MVVFVLLLPALELFNLSGHLLLVFLLQVDNLVLAVGNLLKQLAVLLRLLGNHLGLKHLVLHLELSDLLLELCHSAGALGLPAQGIKKLLLLIRMVFLGCISIVLGGDAQLVVPAILVFRLVDDVVPRPPLLVSCLLLLCPSRI